VSFADAAHAAAALGPLRLVRARARARGFQGGHAQRIAGNGSEFWQYRAVEPGEPIDRVDWRRSARSDALYLREREREDPARLWVWVDGSRSMDFGSTPRIPTKSAIAHLVAGATAVAVEAAGERLFGAQGEPRRAERLYRELGNEAAGTPPLLPLRAGDAVLLVGDFLDGAPLEWVQEAAASGAVGCVISVADPAEADFPFTGRTRFEGGEPGEAEREFARAEALREAYLAAWGAHLAALGRIDAVEGWRHFATRTDAGLDALLGAVASWLGER
jgi:uncharacterized protein (DUF58 family)